MTAFARFLSYLFHPVFAPLISIFLLFSLPIYINYKIPDQFVKFIYGVVFLNLVLSPILVSLFLKSKGIIASLEMKETKERQIPYLISGILYGLTYLLFKQIEMPHFYLSFFLAAFLVIIALLLLSLIHKKVSAHLAALGGICGMLFIVSSLLKLDTTLLLIGFILISGLVASARFRLKSHSFMELILGFGLGFTMQVIVFT
ncbi:MAG: hypothetical protein JKY48_06115 [Flavobacteriales bacterium]|nr:hypothetical protein [Flavobacteriales bacterium]